MNYTYSASPNLIDLVSYSIFFRIPSLLDPHQLILKISLVSKCHIFTFLFNGDVIHLLQSTILSITLYYIDW